MRKNAPRKWLHAILDLLPVILIPVFMIYSHRHTIDSYSVTINGDKYVNKYQTNEVNNLDDIHLNNVYHMSDLPFSEEYNIVQELYINIVSCSNIERDESLMSLSEIWVDQYNATDENYLQVIFYDDFTCDMYFTNNNCYICYLYDSVYDYALDFQDVDLFISDPNVLPYFKDYIQETCTLNNIPLNECITSSVYNEVVLEHNVPIVYDDTDIMSQLTYNLYNSVDKYFNMNNIFGIQGFYDWVQLNLFSGNAPLYVYIVWQIIVYEFVIDLLFFIYAVLMFLIDWIGSLMSRFIDKTSGGNL